MDGRFRVSTIYCAKRRSYCLIKFQYIYPVHYLKNPNERNRLFTKSFCFILEPISKIRLVFRARRETVKKRSIHVVCEHFEPFRNTAMGT